MHAPRRLWGWLCAGSLALHLGLLGNVRLRMASGVNPPARPAGEIAFLGAIVASPLALQEPAGVPRARPPGEDPPMFAKRPPILMPPPLTREPSETVFATPALGALLDTLDSSAFIAEKQLPHTVTMVVAAPDVTAAPVRIRGPARQRELLYRPALTPYLTRVPLTRLRSKELTRATELQLRFTIAADGRVEHVEIAQSSGDPLLDLVGLQYLKDWRFAAAEQGQTRHPAGAWGQITLRLAFEPQP